ncbi:MAG: HAMP domain-containing histidine kinase [Bacteroidales bacterium]|nr:HAMP domain-containing histidine kinase [Bacteroidales bacterium]
MGTGKIHNIWNYISSLGIAGQDRQSDQRTIVLSNQLNFVMFMSMLLLFIAVIAILLLTADTASYGTLRVLNLLIVCFLNLVIARLGFPQLSRLSLIFLPPIVFLLGPTLIGYVEEESYTYYPYVVISASLIPQFLIHPKKEKFLYWFSLAYYFVLVLSIDKIMVNFAADHYPIVDRINTFYPWYKIAQISIFLFINASIYYLRLHNFRFEEELNRKNKELDLQNIELKMQKDEIERQKDELVNKEISTWQKLVNIISHEIVNSAIPITNLAGMSSQMLENESGTVLKPEMIDEEVTEDIHHSLKIIESRTQGLINFVNATKSLTHIPKPAIRKVNLHELLERITILYHARFKETGVKFEKQIIPPDLYIEADLELIEQVIINLIQNALEAMKETSDPRISIIALKNESEQVQISVSDNGIGISNEVLERIFLPFYSTKANSSGIGLSLSQQIMMLHHARLEVKSEPGKGATFIMIF